MTIIEEVELEIEQYFENLEFLLQGYMWEDVLEFTVIILFDKFIPKLKSVASLYPEKKIRDTPIHQLLSFIESINSFLVLIKISFSDIIFTILKSFEKDLFNVLINDKILDQILKLFATIKPPNIDFNFTRFFYSQIIDRWVDSDGQNFDMFLTNIQKILEVIPLISSLFSTNIISSLRNGNSKEYLNDVNKKIDILEKKLLIVPVSLSDRFKAIIIEYISLVHIHADVLYLHYNLETYNSKLITDGLLFSNSFADNCRKQIETIRNIKLKIEANSDFFKKYSLDINLYNSKIKEVEQSIYGHNNILEFIINLKKSSNQNSIDNLINQELELLDFLKNNLNFFSSEIKKILITYIENTLFLIEFWKNIKQILLQKDHLYYLMFEKLNISNNPQFNIIKELSSTILLNLFSKGYFFFHFLEEVYRDLIPSFDHFQLIHQSIFNVLPDITKWGDLVKIEPIKNGKLIIEAVIIFFKRFNASKLQTSFEIKLQSYNNEFIPFYKNFANIYLLNKEQQQERFSNPNLSLEKIQNILENLKTSENHIYSLFSLNLEIINFTDQIYDNFITIKVLIEHFDNGIIDLIEILSRNWDSTPLLPFMRLLNEKMKYFPQLKSSLPNKLREKLLSLNTFLLTIKKLDDYFNDSPSITLTTGTFKENYANFNKITSDLLNLHEILPNYKPTLFERFTNNLRFFENSINPSWQKSCNVFSSFLSNQSKKITLIDRKTLFSQLIEYFETKIQDLDLLFTWPMFLNHLKLIQKEFFPNFKKYFSEFILLEEHWQQSVISLANSQNNFAQVKKTLKKELENFLTKENLDEILGTFFLKIKPILENRLQLLTSSSADVIPHQEMKELIF